MEHITETKSRLVNSTNAIYFKAAFIIFLISLLIIPNGIVESLIRERQNSQYQVQNEIASSWGNRQTISGPILVIPYKQMQLDKDGKPWYTDHQYSLTPTQVNIEADVDTEVRKKSIYEEVLYTNHLNIQGTFDTKIIEAKDGIEIKWSDANMIIGIYDPSAITSSIKLMWNDKIQKMSPGSPVKSILSKGIHAKVNALTADGLISFDTNLDLRGHYHVHFEPIAQNTNIKMKADWPNPGFVGKILADQREITEQGFTAEWKVSEYSRSVPTYWIDTEHSVGNNSAFGVELISPVDHYQKNMRSAKYSLLIICLSFLAFFFFEVMYKKRVHPMQYGFIGLSLSIFYYLLLSISEHLGFDIAYIIASIAVVGLITGYSKSILESSKSLWILAFILIVIYTYIYILLQLEEYALIAGSIGLFVILSAVMYLSRNVDWYNMKQHK